MSIILVVEDNPDILETTSMMLSLEGHEVIGACCAGEGLDIVHARRDIDVLFTDLNLRGMNAWAMLETMRRENRLVPTVIASGDTEARTALPLRPDKPVTFLAKPYGRRQLLAAIRACSQADGSAGSA